MVGGTWQRGATFPIEMPPVIPPVAPSRGGPARGERYPPGATMNPATVDIVVRKRAAMIMTILLVTCMTIPRVV